VVGQIWLDFFWLSNKWAGLGWLTKWSTRCGLNRAESGYPFWQL